MSAAEDDTELRDLLIQNLENSGALNKLKAEMRAAVFLAMEEQDKLENKSPLVNENLTKCLNTKDGRLVASLIMDFLQVFNLDFSLAVFQPEINSASCLDGRDQVCRELGLSDSDLNRESPLMLELVRRGRYQDKAASLAEREQGDRGGSLPKELTQKQITNARKKFDFYNKDHSGSVLRENLKNIFTDLFPAVNKNMLERFVTDELRASDKDFSTTIDFQQFLGMYRRLFSQCRSVVLQDSDMGVAHSQLPEQKVSPPPLSKIPRYKGLRGQSQTAAQDSERSLSKGDFQQKEETSADKRECLDLDLEGEEDLDEGDSFFDDPLPKPQKTYGCPVPVLEESLSDSIVSSLRRGKSLSDLSVLAADTEGERDEPLSDPSELRKAEVSGYRGSPAASLSEAQRPASGGRGGQSSVSEPNLSRNGASQDKDRGFKAPSDRSGSLHLDDEVEYDDDFNSHRSDLSKSELSIGEEIEEVSIEGPDHSDKVDESTQDVSVSQLSQSHGADYMEDVG
ncbi:centrosomal protein 43 isoform X2 [Oreochromis niloticus]|uniref:centrosomal protein 43 isoform X2 n=1 Tax=Oreochromis niloticus TaxID=8128 RepID=UPI0006747870|nr:FGFR1 oncogene partner isoform X2 [Oreochromis niloticus]